MGLLNPHSESNPNGAAIHGSHHPTRDGAIAGAVAHHESNQHPDRNTALAAGGVGALEHHRNHEQLAHNHNNGINGGVTGTGPTGTGAAYGTQQPAGGYNGLNTGVGGTGANTGPAPLHGAHAASNTSPVSSGSGIPASLNSVKRANSLERKGKLESALASITCSSSMRHKSQNHLAQADHLRMQSSELGEAERLENEAGMRRQRAVGLGANPEHASGTTGFAPNNGVGMNTMGGNRTAAVA